MKLVNYKLMEKKMKISCEKNYESIHVFARSTGEETEACLTHISYCGDSHTIYLENKDDLKELIIALSHTYEDFERREKIGEED